MKKLLFILLMAGQQLSAQQYAFKIGLLKYRGGGDWYANLETSIRNLALFCNQELGTAIDPEQAVVEVGSREIFNHPLVHVTGHGNIVLDNEEKENLRAYLTGGGFLHIDDNYGFDPFIRKVMEEVLPGTDFVELPPDHEIYNQAYSFPKGMPKIHEHDDKEAKGYGLFLNGRLVCFYSYETDLGDGWESPEVHGDSPEQRQKALRMGANIVQYVLNANDAVE